MTFDFFMIWTNLYPSCCDNTEKDCCMAFANMQVSELWPMGLFYLFIFIYLFFFFFVYVFCFVFIVCFFFS